MHSLDPDLSVRLSDRLSTMSDTDLEYYFSNYGTVSKYKRVLGAKVRILLCISEEKILCPVIGKGLLYL